MEELNQKRIDRAVLVGLNADCFPKEETATETTLDELEALLNTAGGECAGKILQNKHTPDPRSFIGEIEPPKQSKPAYHMFILLLSVTLVFVIAAALFSAFLIAEVPFRAWLFFVFAVPVASIVCIVFTSLWWGIWQQSISISVLIWSLGVCLYLTLRLPNLSLLFIVCAALQVLVILWELFRKYRKK